MTASINSQRWLLYAMGGGLGHFTRSVALARASLQLAREHGESVEVHLLTNCSIAVQVQSQQELAGVQLHHVDRRTTPEQTREETCRVCAAIDPSVLVVDTFPRGLGGELPPFLSRNSALRVLTHRDLNPRYVARFGLEEFTAQNYDLILSPGESGPLVGCTRTVRTNPWLICDADDLADRETARGKLGAEAGKPFIAVLASGKDEERLAFATSAEKLTELVGGRATVRLIRPPGQPTAKKPRALGMWPLLPCINGVDLVVGAGGYNTVYEMRASRTPLVALAQPRLYDLQRKRLHNELVAEDVDQLVEAAEKAIRIHGCKPADSGPRYDNGARDAAAQILNHIREEAVQLEEAVR